MDTFTSDDKFYFLRKGKNIALILSLICKKQSFPPGDKDCDGWEENDEFIQKLLCKQLIDLLDVLCKSTKKKYDRKTFDELVNDVAKIFDIYIEKKEKIIGVKEVEALQKFTDFMLMEVKPHVKRISVKTNLNNLIDFVDELKISQSISPIKDLLEEHKFAKNPVYFGAWLPPSIRDNNSSNHITIAYSKAEKEKLLNYVGTKVNIIPAKNIVEWQDDNGDKYSYRPYMIMYYNGHSQISHNSIHILEGGINYGKNHIHQQSSSISYDLDIDKTTETLIISFYTGRSSINTDVFIQCDFDQTISKKETVYKDGKFNPSLLDEPSTIKNNSISNFGRLINQIEIPFRIVTSRTAKSNRKEMEHAMKKIFPKCIEISWGKKNRCPPGPQRDKFKADDKNNRFYPNMWCFDDEEIVIKTHGYGSIIVDETITTHYHGTLLTGIHVALAINGPVGVGKSTLINNFINHIGGVVPFINDDGKSPLVMIASADGSEPDHNNLPYEQFAKSYPERDTYFIFDTTGSGRKNMKIPVFRISPNLTPTVFTGCFLSILEREDHPNLNGINPIDLNGYDKKYEPYDTNGMDLTTFINYIWFTRCESQIAFEQVFTRIGQIVSFTPIGNVLFLITSYREGLQFWNSIWGRQNRKCVHAFIGDKWKIIKSGLEVGAEMKPNIYSEDGDVYKKGLSSYQNQVCVNLFTNNELPIGTTLTSKKDGSLIQVTRICEDVETIYNAIMESDNTFAKIFSKISYEESGGKYFYIISTNGTLLAAEHMWDYILTAIMCDLNMSYDGIDNKELVLSKWKEITPLFTSKNSRLFDNLDININSTHQLEAICPKRITCMGIVHPELALSYENGGIISLGIRYGNKYIPHFILEKELNLIGFEQPLFWKKEINILELLNGVQNISTNPNYSVDKFIHEFPPDNKYIPANPQIDHEGFVLLVKTNTNKEWDYGKLKTLLYYLFHKPRDNNMEQLIKLSRELKLPHFPASTVIRDMNRILLDKDHSSLYTKILKVMDKYSPTEPSIDETERKIIGIWKNYSQKKTLVETNPTYLNITNFLKFMISNNKDCVNEIYPVIMDHFENTYIIRQYLQKENNISLDKKINYSLSTVINIIYKSPSMNIVINNLIRHMMYIKINLPEK